MLIVTLAALLAGVGLALALRDSRVPGVGQPRAMEAKAPQGDVQVRMAGRVIARLESGEMVRRGRLNATATTATVRRSLALRLPVRVGGAKIVYRLDRKAVIRDILAGGAGDGSVDVLGHAESSSITAPVVAQLLRNNCESAALEVLLATLGVKRDQLRLQGELARSGRRDPVQTPDGRTWGDPELGYVGRPEGGGAAGGFGVYQEPIRWLAREHGRELDDLTGSSPAAVYGRLLSGRAVMAWVGLSDGPYGTWRSPGGRDVTVNFGEHTVVLTGLRRDGALRVVNVLQGTAETWSRAKFERMWELLDRRAVSPAAA